MYNEENFEIFDYLDFVFGVQTEQTERLQIARHFDEFVNDMISGFEAYKEEFGTREAVEKHLEESKQKALARIMPILDRITHEYYLAQNN